MTSRIAIVGLCVVASPVIAAEIPAASDDAMASVSREVEDAVSGPSRGLAAATEDTQRNAQAWQNLADAIAYDYAHRDLRVRNWTERFAARRHDASHATSAEEFAAIAAAVLAPAGDIHLRLAVGDNVFPSHRVESPGNVDPDVLLRTLPGRRAVGEGIVGAVIRRDGSPAVGYMAIDAWPPEPRSMDPAVAFVAELTREGINNIVVDVRANAGGAEATARRLAGCFVRETAVYAAHRVRDRRSPDGWGRWRSREISPGPFGEGQTAPFAGGVVVLQGARSVSATESFLLMMRFGAHAVLMGERSAGSSGNPKPVELGNGVVVHLPTWQCRFPDGTPLEGRGVTPDIIVPWPPGSSSAEDAVLAAALELFDE